MLDHNPILSPGHGYAAAAGQNHKMVPVFVPTRTSTTLTGGTDIDKDMYYKTTELPPLPLPPMMMMNGKDDCRGR